MNRTRSVWPMRASAIAMSLIAIWTVDLWASAGVASPADAAKEATPAPLRTPQFRQAVELDSVVVYWCPADDSTAARLEADSVARTLDRMLQAGGEPAELTLREENGIAFLERDSTLRLRLAPENRADTAASPLANALDLRKRLSAAPRRPAPDSEEILLLRLFLGIVFPFLLLVVLRMTRLGLRRWERRWRPALRSWLAQSAARRGRELTDTTRRKIFATLTMIERLAVFSVVLFAVSFTWFALFPDTRPLAYTLLQRILTPALELLALTARGVLLLSYSVAVLFIAATLNRNLARRRRLRGSSDSLSDPAVHLPVRIAIWLVALFLVLFPYPGAPRMFAVGVLVVTIFAALVALRPVTEEIASGIYLNMALAIRIGDVLQLDGRSYKVLELGLAQVLVSHEGREFWIPYTRVLRSEIMVRSKHGPRR